MIKEDFLHYVWKLRKFDFRELFSTDGQYIEVHETGFHNTHAGPDFLQARISIDDILWVGSVEIHLKSSDWYKHHHQDDPAYNNVILHVVLEEDGVIRDGYDAKIPCLELRKRINTGDLKNYLLLQHEHSWIPCAPQMKDIPQLVLYQATEKSMMTRLQRKSGMIEHLLDRYDNHWEQVLLILLFRYFGTNVNSEAFEMLARSFSPVIIHREKCQPGFIEALLFGQSGLLIAQFRDEYAVNLLKDYHFLQKKYGLHPIPVASWKFLRLRPDNFPTVRIAQLAAILNNNQHFFNRLINTRNIREIYEFFGAEPAIYWSDHYLFDKKSVKKIKLPGKNFLNILIINVIVAIKYVYGIKTGNAKLKLEALGLLEQVPAESNHIIKNWKALQVHPKNAFESQGLLELKNGFCSRKRCLECPIGHHLMKRKDPGEDG